MSEIDYQALRAKAEKATCGEWSLEYGEGRFDGDDALIHREVVGYLPICRIEGAHPESGFDEDFQMEQQANAEFIAAANPATVLALLGELEAAENNLIDSECHVAELEEALRDKQALLEASEKRIAELEAREVVLPRAHDVHPLGPQSAKIFCEFHRSIVNRCADEIRKVGVKVSIKGN
ncbi:ead/Ea22-like family protein [Escherichia coli]|nr:ead/Ea22-like family protein [Escherichia coli]